MKICDLNTIQHMIEKPYMVLVVTTITELKCHVLSEDDNN